MFKISTQQNNTENYLMKELVNELAIKVTNLIDNYLIEGLKRKNITYQNNEEFLEIVKNRCRCEDNVYIKQKVFFLDDVPFMVHNYTNGNTISLDGNNINMNYDEIYYI